MLTLIKMLDKRAKDGHKIGLYRCICGTEKEIRSDCVNSNRTKSCGCTKKGITKKRPKIHNLSKTIEYKIWMKIQNRCYNKTNNRYKYYGGRGIEVCDRWLEIDNGLKNFIDDLG